jgi:uncharacterized Zn-binding protein involved in type VI secretion
VGQPAVLLGDRIQGQCLQHKIINPATGAPQPAPPMPFMAMLTMSLATTVKIANKAAAVEGSQGTNAPPHVPPLHPSDSNMVPTTQIGKVAKGSGTVKFDGKPAAYTGCDVTICANAKGMVQGTGMTVLIGA